MANEIRFTLQGEVEEPAATSRGAHATHGTRVVKRVRLGSTRGQASTQSLVARVGQDVVVLHINGGPSLTLHPESAAALMRAQTAGSTGRSAVLPDGSVEVPMQLGWPGLEQAAGATAAARGASRGWLGQVFASAMEVVTGQSGQPMAKLSNLAAAAVTLKLDGQVDPGVYALQPGALNKLKGSGYKLDAVPAAPTGQPLLVLIHGTFVDTTSTFGKFWAQYPQRVRELFSFYANRVYALDHRTMGDSPITNALQLVRALPAGAVLHLLTHSRGGVVAEVLARACAQQGLDDESLSGFTAAYATERADLLALAELCRQKNISVQRMLRVACPARGTLLASGRLDAYLSVLQWLLNAAGIPVAGALVDFLDEVARVRGDPAQLPGLEALMPTSPLVLWLNGVAERDEPLASELRVVAGDMQGDSIGSWLKVLMSDAFYWTDNDLVVQTRSMYGGTPRGGLGGAGSGGAAQFLLDRGAGVSHFIYFSNERTAAAVVAGLTQARPEGFATIGPLSWQGDDASGSRAARTVPTPAADAAQRPALIFLPGVLGSNLKSGDRRIWLSLNFFNRLSRLRWDPLGNPGVTPDGVVGRVYGDLAEYLRGTHEVIVFDYDWRAPMEAEARRLGAVLEREIALRQASKQPVRMLAHSMGGLLARTVQLECPNVWNDWMARHDTRLLLLGTPHAGAWTPMQVLSGDDTFGNTLVAMGGLFANHATRQLIANLPGFVQLQAGLLDNDGALAQEATWAELSERDQRLARQYNAWHSGEAQLEAYRWGVPPQAVLDQAAALRRRLDGQAAALQACAAKLVQVVGQVRFTPTGMSVGAGGVEYLDAPQRGDGRVTWDSALLPGVATWLLPVAHDKLPACAEAFDDYVKLLLGQKPDHLAVLDVAATLAKPPAPDSLRRSRPARASTAEPPPATLEQAFAMVDDGAAAATGNGTGASSHRPALRVQVVNGDLRFVQGALLLGHYRALELSGTEAVVDHLLGQRMSESLATGLYPASPGSHQVFVNRSRNLRNPLLPPQPAAVVVAGLGDEGKLSATELVHTIRLAVLAHAQHVLQNAPATQAPPPFELTATLVGSGGPGISPGISAQLVAQGVREADEQLQDTGWPRVAGLTLIEWYLDRAGEAWLALQAQAQATPGRIDLARAVKEGTGGLRRALEGNYRGAAHDLISAVQTLDENQQPLITYTVDTRRARSEVRAQRAQGPLLEQLVKSASNDGNRDAQIGRTLFNLLVPIELEPTLAGSSEMLLELDAATAAIPWELLNTDAAQTHCDPRPWAIRTKLLRKLRTANFRDAVRDASREDHVLVIGEPKCDATRYPPLPGARAEAQAVALQLADQLGPDKVTALVSGSDDSRSIINALYSQHFRVVHVAGHGEPGANGGVVLSDGIFLGANEVRAMRTVPELVFLNCCHLGGRDAAALTQHLTYDRAAFAANIADELIRAGVRCVVAAGWAVEDGPAELFATTFYAALRRGERFSHAVAQAREAAWEANPQGNTWAAYQCYGDPGWRWRDSAHANVQAKPNPLAEYGAVSSALALNLALDTLAVRCRYSNPGQGQPQAQPVHDKLHALEDRFAPLWGSQGTVAEAFGAAYAEAGDTARAIGWYRRAEAALDGSASFRCAEQLANLIARSAEKDADLARAESGLAEAVQRLHTLCALQATPERQALLGSAYKRQALLHARQGRRRSELAALRQAVHHYERAERLAAAGQASNLFYPALNGLGVQMRLAALERKTLKWPRARLAAIDASLKAAQAAAPDFWCEVGAIELRLYRAVAARRLARLADDLADAFNNLALRVAAPRLWDSVATNERMVLEPYAQRADAPEAKAARLLLATLAALAAPAAPASADNAASP